ncbi:MAG: serine/threonine protein kinase, partial [Phycisphaerales bacterium]|nr:serine/threonine protein kinase [Phycisphaerales bacterium]
MGHQEFTVLSLAAGDTLLGRYRLERLLGQGGMGTVWLATDGQLDRLVAVKVLPAVLGRDPRAVANLKDEARRNLDLTHPHIVRLYTFEQDPARSDVPFLVMQYIEGHTLNEMLVTHRNGLPLDRVKVWAHQIAAAIDHAHAQRILHRDIKPSNIIVEASTDRAYLMDFGIAREARDTLTRVTGQHDSSGTLPYMSPQQMMGRNERSNDVYSFAATLYECLCGHPPFCTGDIPYQIREVDPPPLEGVSASVNEAILRGLHKSAEERPATAMAMLSRKAASSAGKSRPRVEAAPQLALLLGGLIQCAHSRSTSASVPPTPRGANGRVVETKTAPAPRRATSAASRAPSARGAVSSSPRVHPDVHAQTWKMVGGIGLVALGVTVLVTAVVIGLASRNKAIAIIGFLACPPLARLGWVMFTEARDMRRVLLGFHSPTGDVGTILVPAKGPATATPVRPSANRAETPAAAGVPPAFPKVAPSARLTFDPARIPSTVEVNAYDPRCELGAPY